MLHLALATLRVRKGAFAASFIVLLLGTAIVMACGGLMETGITSADPRAGKMLVPLSGVFGGIAIMVAVFVVSSTLGLSVQLRRREMALLRTIGSTPMQLRRLIMGETLLIAVLAAAAGYLPGGLLGTWLLDQIARSGGVPSSVTYQQGWIPTMTGFGVGLLTALSAAFIASRRAAVTPPTEALTEADLQRQWLSGVRLAFALLCLGLATALAAVTATVMNGSIASSTAGPAAMLWASGFGLLAPGCTKALTAVLRLPLRALPGAAGHLAMLNASARTVRMAGSVTPVMLAVGLATALLYIQASEGELTGAWVNYLLVAMIVVYTVISLVNTLVIATTQRQREFGLQRLIGSTYGQVIRMIAVEAVLIALVSIVLGTAIALLTLVPFAMALDGSLLPPGPLWIYFAVTGTATALTVVTALVAGAIALRSRPVIAAAAPA
ncbi:ABC transporter permease [Streptomyces sp. NPDC054841]